MKTENEVKRDAESRVFIASHTSEEIKQVRKRILRRYTESPGRGIEPLSETELRQQHIVIRALKDRGDLRCGFDIVKDEDSSKYCISETFKTTSRRRSV